MQTQPNSVARKKSAVNDSAVSLDTLKYSGEFIDRHIGPSKVQIEQMLQVLNLESLDDLIASTVPQAIALKSALELDEPLAESAALAKLKKIAEQNGKEIIERTLEGENKHAKSFGQIAIEKRWKRTRSQPVHQGIPK